MKVQSGFIISSHWSDGKNGVNLEFYGTTGEHPFKLTFTDQKIVFFIPHDTKFNPGQVRFERKSQNLKNFKHVQVDAIYLNRYHDVSVIRDYCQQSGIITYELDILPTERFLMERFINAEVEFTGESTWNDGAEEFYNCKVRPGFFNGNLGQLSLDIETGSNNELYSIGLYFKKANVVQQKVLMVADHDEVINSNLEFYDHEKKLLVELVNLFKTWDPDIVTGWHVIGFDFKFLENKFIQYSIPMALGRQSRKLQIVERKGAGFYADIPGRYILDGPPVLRGAFYQFKDFKLETVASEVLGIGKDIASDNNKATEIERRFKEDKLALAKYNILDCKLVIDILDKLKIVELLMSRSKISGLLFDRLPVSTAAFDHVYLPRLHRKGFVAPNKIDIVRDEASTGGMVIEPVSGLHKDVAVFDFKSLYPSIIMTFKVDPLGKVKLLPPLVKTPKGIEFSKVENILPELISNLMQQRQLAKNDSNGPLSQAIKILMNSFYGVMGSSRCRFYHADLPTAITTTGHWILQKSIEFFENNCLEVIYGDTDSIFVKMLPEHKAEYCQNLAAGLNSFLSKLIQDEFKVKSYLECEFEKKFNQLFFAGIRNGVGAAKKKYVGMIDYKIEFKGMEFVRSDWTELAKDFQMQLFEKFFAGEELELFIKDTIVKLESGVFDAKLIYKKRLTKDPSEYTKNIPPHVKAALQIDHKGPYRLKEVSYVISKEGPVPIQKDKGEYDYSHYIEKQLRPIANDILQSQGKEFDSIIGGEQLSLF